MKLFYCGVCNLVAAFNVFDIRKHGLKEVGDRCCPVCGEASYVPVKSDLEELGGL